MAINIAEQVEAEEVDKKFKEFNKQSKSNALNYWKGRKTELINIIRTGNDIEIVSNDGKRFLAKEKLMARNPVFDAMFNTEMIEKATNKVVIQDIGSKALKVVIKYILNGSLLPEWREPEVIVELTYAAGKYLLTDLLQFLNGVLGKVVSSNRNAAQLHYLAIGLGLENAQKELKDFIWRGIMNGTIQLYDYDQSEIELNTNLMMMVVMISGAYHAYNII